MDNTREKLIELLCEVQYQGNAVHGYSDRYIQNGELADHLIAHGVTLQDHDYHWATETAYKNGYEAGKPKWIPVSERLPEHFGTFLAAIDEVHGEKRISADAADFDPERKRWETWNYFCAGYKVTHWMPLPEPPKGE